MANDKLIHASAARKAILKADPKLAYVIDNVPAADAVEMDALESWLSTIAINSMSSPLDNDIGLVCAMLIERLDGLREFARERRTDNA